MRNKVLDHRSNDWPQDPRLARREAESRLCRGRGDDELISDSQKSRVPGGVNSTGWPGESWPLPLSGKNQWRLLVAAMISATPAMMPTVFQGLSHTYCCVASAACLARSVASLSLIHI